MPSRSVPVYGNILSAEGGASRSLDGDDSSWRVSAQYDLGGGATVNGGVRQTYDSWPRRRRRRATNSATIADFGIKMAF